MKTIKKFFRNPINRLLFFSIVTIFILLFLLCLPLTIFGIQESFKDLFINLLSNLLFIALFLLAGERHIGRRYKSIMDFYGINNSKKINIYLSDLKINPRGAKGLNGQDYSFEGDAIASKEFQVGEEFRGLPSVKNPFSSELNSSIQNLFWTDIRIEIKISRIFTDNDTNNGIIILGTPVYNPASKYLQENNLSIINLGYSQITRPEWRENMNPPYSIDTGGTASSFPIIPSGVTTSASSVNITTVEYPYLDLHEIGKIIDPKFGFLERIYDEVNQRSFFYCVGLSDTSTAGAAYFLVREWEHLSKEFKQNTNFLLPVIVVSNDFHKVQRANWKNVPIINESQK